MSPLETYAEAKRSGTHPDTLENWPDQPENIAAHTPAAAAPAIPTVQDAPAPAASRREFYFSVLHFILSIILLLAVLWLFWTDSDINGSSAQLYKEAPPKIIYKTRTRTKVVKQYAQTASKWRKKLCYEYGDWDSCLAYKTNLPLRARVGRTDLY
jgi:hypothetical protein